MTDDLYLKSVFKRLRTSAATADAVDGFQAFVTPEEARALLAHIRAQDAEIARLREERAPSCQNGCLLMVKCHDVEEYYEDKDDATNT